MIENLVLENVILDCLFDEKEGIYYVLDIMCWSNHPVYDSEVKYENSSWIFMSFIQYRNIYIFQGYIRIILHNVFVYID